jgi:isochorismate synthase
MPADCTALDFLTATNRSFAVYRVPGRSSVLHLQSDEGTGKLKSDGSTGTLKSNEGTETLKSNGGTEAHRQNGVTETLKTLSQLNGRSGFVMAPFCVNDGHPVVLIRPDIILKGERVILKYMERLKADVRGNSNFVQVHAQPSGDEDDPFSLYQGAFELFQKALHAGSCDKIVLSRTLRKTLPKTFSAGNMYGAACSMYPDAFVYLCHTPEIGTWLGCTPELLLSGESGRWKTVALAGTKKSTDRQVVWDSKNIQEQKIVTAYLEKQLIIKNLNASISEPYTVKAGQMVHIKTDFQFEMPDQQPLGNLLDFLHPTPAVCGYPKSEAYRLILAHEGYDRSYYSGFAGPLNMDGKTDLYVNVRCASLDTNVLTLYAGGGLMPDSELKSEWEETETKLQTLLSLMDKRPEIHK